MSETREAWERAKYAACHYPNSQVLRNKFGILDKGSLSAVEGDFVLSRLPTRPKHRLFSLAEMQAVHRHIFQDVYDWAGRIRDYTTGRGSGAFAVPERIGPYFGQLHDKLARESFLRGSSPEHFADRAGYYANELNSIHPFIDGNGRTLRIYLQDLATQAGYNLDVTRLDANKDGWYKAMSHGHDKVDHALVAVQIRSALTPLTNALAAVGTQRGETKPVRGRSR